ncbi:ATP-binding cassette domain-containing protein [Arthrobacter echini]|uniref:ATP-binding cassette domain-containing protein n=1 Tax=Arthrobacter echini TaxID=1529066 RepID=A0A4S5E3Z4_9MICC|nr:ATP-binding cassette domain-containing protein [Arthrobacter echini]THJ66166.1 ATP-binding cassette domain-containing protein [Arthrobacter echini]
MASTNPGPAAPPKQAAVRPAVSLRGAGLSFGTRTLWQGLDVDIMPGEFLAVLGPNGSGKTSLLKVLLGLQALDEGTALLDGRPVARGSRALGYIPQQKSFPPETPLRARDLVGLGVDGHRWGVRWRTQGYTERVDALLEDVGARSYADTPVGLLSGGEQQRLRAAQALAADPAVLLCDEPLLSLDLHHQQAVSALINRQSHERNSAVVFVTHEINPVIDYVDRVLYLADGRFRVGAPSEVMTSEVLSDLYRSPVEVLESNGRIVVVGLPDATTHHHEVV